MRGVLCVDTGSYAASYAACLLRVLCVRLVREPGLGFRVACRLPQIGVPIKQARVKCSLSWQPWQMLCSWTFLRKCLMRGLMRLMRELHGLKEGYTQVHAKCLMVCMFHRISIIIEFQCMARRASRGVWAKTKNNCMHIVLERFGGRASLSNR